jgi:flagellar hook assembly protein FlgD
MVLGSFASFAVTQRLKHTPTIVQDIEMSASFTPGSRTHNAVERISFKIAHTDRVRVTVIDSQDNTVRTLARDSELAAYKRAYFYWNGHEARGRHAPGGTYRVRIELLGQKREVLSPAAFELVGQ